MDFKTSRKETKLQPDGPVDVLVDSVCDLYPIFGDDPRYDGMDIYVDQLKVTEEERKNIIMDAETIDDSRAELLDRAMFAVSKQRGQNPVEPLDGIQWAEVVMGEVIAPIIIQQVYTAVAEEGPGVTVTTNTARRGNKSYAAFRVDLADVRRTEV
jgi:hypothetical protein